jgi:hypothetical protein
MRTDRLEHVSKVIIALSKIFCANTSKEGDTVSQRSQVMAECCLHINFSLHFVPAFLFRIHQTLFSSLDYFSCGVEQLRNEEDMLY